MSVTMTSTARQSAAIVLALIVLLATLLVTPSALEASGIDTIRFATFNASLNRSEPGQALSDLSQPFDPAQPVSGVNLRRQQAANVAEIIQRVRPEVLLINEFDYVDGPITGNALTTHFQNNYLSIGHNGAEPITYPYVFVAPSNTGIHSGFDLNNNGAVVATPLAPGYGDDALGFGEFPGKFGMAVFSQHPIDYEAARTFQRFLWKDMPGALLPTYPESWPVPELRGEPWYTGAELDVLPLSSKSHWDIPIQVGEETVHFLTSHPTPPVFDSAEDRNGKRNHDEIRLWADYVTPGAGDYIYDDGGTFGGLEAGASFVIAGDQNSDPRDGDSVPGAIQQLLDNPRVNAHPIPSSEGAKEASALQGRINDAHRSNARWDTADFADGAPGNLRADYVLPSRDLRILDSAVFWPEQADPLFRLVGVFDPFWLPVGGFPSSDHRLVWVDVFVPGSQAPT